MSKNIVNIPNLFGQSIHKLITDCPNAFALYDTNRLYSSVQFEMVTLLFRGLLDLYGKKQLVSSISATDIDAQIIESIKIIKKYMGSPLYLENKSYKVTVSEMLDLLETLRDSKKERIYNERKSFYPTWAGNYVRETEMDNIKSCFEYIISNENIEWRDFYDALSSSSSNSRYINQYMSDKKHIAMELLALKDPDAFDKKYPKTFKGMNKLYRSAYYCGVIAQGKADKKFIRRMRSETASITSLRALECFIKYKDKYSDFDSWIMQFNDSKHQEVVDKLIQFYDRSNIMHMLGNPLSNKENIRRKLMS